jgi:hypothetical protein
MKIKLYILLFLSSTTFFAQKLSTSVDPTKNKIGAEFKLTLKANVFKNDKVVFPKGKMFGNLEVLEAYKTDTVVTDDKMELVKKYGLTQFDSGKYTIPKLKVLINGKPYLSDSIQLEIANVKVDTLKQKMYDIKDILPAKSSFNWWPLIITLLVLIILGGILYFYFIQKKKQKVEEVLYKSPIEKATSLLQLLETKDLLQRGEIKEYYSELTDIVRTYIEEEIEIPAMESTTSELIFALKDVSKRKKLKLNKETLINLEKVLKQADLVKFAKVRPLDFEIEEDKKRITSAVVKIHDSIPEEVEEKDALTEYNEQQKEIARKKKELASRKKKIINISAIIVGCLVIATLFVTVAKGFDYVKDFVLGNHNKELLEGNWISSEYGNPSIKIETPEVLKRLDANKVLPKNAMALIKEMQLFNFGGLNESFSVTIATKKFKQKTEVNLDQLADESAKLLESQGATNLIFKQEDYKTNKGIEGKKAFGTMTFVDKASSSSQKLYYEMVFFKQDGGIQQITITYKENDNFGAEVAARILNSIELENTQQQ